MTSIPTSGPYASIMQGFLGFLTPAQQQAYWNGFLQINGLTSNPLNTDTAKVGLFAGYVNEVASVLSSVEQTRIVLTIFDVLTTMMKTMTNTQLTTQQNLAYWAKKQKAYTDMASKVAITQGSGQTDLFTPLPTDIVPSSDPTQYKLGFAGLTMQDVLGTIQAIAHGGDPQTFSLAANTLQNVQLEAASTMHLPYNVNSFITMSATPDANNPGTFTFTAQAFHQVYTFAVDPPSLVSSQVFSTTITPAMTTQDQINAMHQAFWSAFQSFAGFTTSPVGIPWSRQYPTFPTSIPNPDTSPFAPATLPILEEPSDIRFTYTGDNSSLLNQANLNVKRRAEANATVQTSLDAIKTKKDILRDIASSVQRTVDSSSQGRLQLTNIIQSTVKQLSNILNNIFK